VASSGCSCGGGPRLIGGAPECRDEQVYVTGFIHGLGG
jgi:hypothetical protein